MKLPKWICALWAFLLSFGLSVASVMGIATAFSFQIDTGLLIRCCGIAAVAGSLCFTLPLDLLPVGAGALALGYLWQKNLLLSSVDAFLYKLSLAYNRAYGWDIVRLSARTVEEMEPDIVFLLCIFGCGIALLISWSFCRKNSAIPGLLLSFLTLAPCFVVNDCVPDTGWLYLFFCCFIILVITGSVRNNDTRQGNRLCFIVAPITAVALLFLFAAIPQDTYNGQQRAEKLSEAFISSDLIQHFLGHSGSGADPAADGKSVDLKTVGYRMETHIETLEVTAPFTGTLYLRGRAMDLYDGVSWTDSGSYYPMLTWPGFHLDKIGEVSISTRFAHQFLYVPYYANITDMRNVTLGLKNEKKLTDYSFTYRQLPEGNYLSQLEFHNYMAGNLAQYISMNADVQRWAAPLARKITSDADNPYQTAQAIASYVRNSASYSTHTRRMPGAEKDFAKWFLEDSESGYCVHFATASTVLLQAAGLPARYVTGYAVQVEEGKPVTVFADQAHAWAEYWLPGFGWAVLESTPPDNGLPVDAPAVNTPVATDAPDTVPSQPDTELSEIGGVSQPDSQNTEKAPAVNTSSTLLIKILLWAVSLAAIPALLILQRWLRMRSQEKKLLAATNNEKALLYWQAVTRYAKLLKEPPDPMLLDLAQRAKFSQHTLTEAELELFRQHLTQSAGKLKQKNLFYRFCCRYIWVLY